SPSSDAATAPVPWAPAALLVRRRRATTWSTILLGGVGKGFEDGRLASSPSPDQAPPTGTGRLRRPRARHRRLDGFGRRPHPPPSSPEFAGRSRRSSLCRRLFGLTR